MPGGEGQQRDMGSKAKLVGRDGCLLYPSGSLRRDYYVVIYTHDTYIRW